MLKPRRVNRMSGLLVAGLVAAVALSFASGAQAYQCKSSYKNAEAIAPGKAQSIASAKAIWHNTVNNIYGLQWSAWDIAKSKHMDCDFTGNNWWCRAKAKPCLYVVG